MKDIFLLDADETLLDFRRGEREQLFLTLAFFGVKATQEMISRFHEINEGLWKALERGETTRRDLSVARFRGLFEEYRICADPEAASRRYYRNMQNAAYYLLGAREFLVECKKRGRIYIVTNGTLSVQRARFRLLGLDALADGVFISEEVGFDKPSARFAECVCGRIENFDCRRAVWLGDSLTSDMPCAAAARVDFVLYCRERPSGYGGLVARDYKEALNLFDKL